MDVPEISRFRENIRHIERELNIQNNSHCSQGVTLAQCHTLLELFSDDNISLSELSDRLYLDKSTVSRTIEGLVKSDMVLRNIPDENRRKVIISLTPKGSDLCKQINIENDNYFSDVLDSIPQIDRPVFLKSFEKIVHKMIQYNKEKKKLC